MIGVSEEDLPVVISGVARVVVEALTVAMAVAPAAAMVVGTMVATVVGMVVGMVALVGVVDLTRVRLMVVVVAVVTAVILEAVMAALPHKWGATMEVMGTALLTEAPPHLWGVRAMVAMAGRGHMKEEWNTGALLLTDSQMRRSQ